MTTADALLELASRSGAEPEVEWGMLRVLLTPPLDLAEIKTIVAENDYRAIGTFGTSGIELDLDDASPSQAELDQLANLAVTLPTERDVRASASGWVAAEILSDQLTHVEIRYRRPNWCHSVAEFNALVQSDWLRIADSIESSPVAIGDEQIGLREVHQTEPRVLVPTGSAPEGSSREVWDGLMAIADASAWRNIAVDEQRSRGTVHLALHRDQEPTVEVRPEVAAGGVALLEWLRQSQDGNREEALRYILRFLTASSKHLPDGTAARALAERQRIALSRENAAEVHRAISEGQVRTAEAIDALRHQLGQFVEDTSKTAQASVVASIGVVALVARSTDALPDWLVLLVSLGAITGVVLLVGGRWRRLNDLASDIDVLRGELNRDPLLPEQDRVTLTDRVDKFDAKARARGARAVVALLGTLAVVVIAGATGWLLWGDDEAEDADTSDVVSVEGFVRWEDGVGEICSQLTSEEPPACTGPSWILRGADAGDFDLEGDPAGVQAGESSVRVAGAVSGEFLDVVAVGR